MNNDVDSAAGVQLLQLVLQLAPYGISNEWRGRVLRLVRHNNVSEHGLRYPERRDRSRSGARSKRVLIQVQHLLGRGVIDTEQVFEIHLSQPAEPLVRQDLVDLFESGQLINRRLK